VGPIAAGPLAPDEQLGYDVVLGESRAPLRAVVRKRADRDLPLGKGMKKDVDWFLDLREKDQFVKAGGRNANPVTFAMAGMAGAFSFDHAKQLGLVKVAGE